MSDGIVYQNKDIQMKLLSETFKEKSFKALGLNLPKIKEVLPTNLPKVTADEKRIDNVFLLEDDTIAIVDFESKNEMSNRVKCLNYVARILERYYPEKLLFDGIGMVQVMKYTGLSKKQIEEIKNQLNL